MKKLKILLVLILITTSNVFAASFYDRSKEGWYWYEDKKPVKNKEFKTKDPKEAKAMHDQLVEELDGLRYVMMMDPSVENVVAYRKKEYESMMSKALAVGKSYNVVNYENPELFDRLESPVNVHAVKVKRGMEEKQEQNKIRTLAQGYSLVVFRKESCDYSKDFEPVLYDFAKEYSFEVEAVNVDDSQSIYFPNAAAPELVRKLGINKTPVVYLVGRDGKYDKEFSRGYLAGRELEMNASMAYDRLNSCK